MFEMLTVGTQKINRKNKSISLEKKIIKSQRKPQEKKRGTKELQTDQKTMDEIIIVSSYILLWFGSLISPKGLFVKDLFPRVVVRPLGGLNK
jgi:hypothetical protein